MEIFQTIWTALTTENKQLTDLIGLPATFLECFVLMQVFISLLNVEANKKQKVQYVLIVSSLGIIGNLFIPNPYNTFVNFLVIFLGIYFIFKTSILKSIACLIVPIAICSLIESIYAKIYSAIFNIDFLTGANIPLHRLIGTLVIYSLWYLTSVIFKLFKINFEKLQILDKKQSRLLIFNAFAGVILIFLQVYVTYFYSSVLPIYIVLLSLASLLVYVGLSLYTNYAISQLEYTSTNLEEAKLYNKTLEILHDNTRAFRHDMTNILIGMTGYIDSNDMDGLKEYHKSLLEDIKQTNNLTALSPKIVNNPAIYNVLANKYYKADNLGIKINLEIFIDLNELHINIYEFTRILGILLDNAIEASQYCEDKIINVSIRKDNRKHQQLLVIENTYLDKNIDTDKIYEKGYTTKEGNTGLGLWEIRQILKKNNNLNLYTLKTEKYFSQQLEIYY